MVYTQNLSKWPDTLIIAAVKGGTVVVCQTSLYQNKASQQLSDISFYAKVKKDLTSANQKIAKDTIWDLIAKQELPVTATNLIVNTPQTSCTFFLPQIHKENNPAQPIVSACSCPTKLISNYLDKIMVPIVKSLPSHIKDGQHALEIFHDFNFSRKQKLIFTISIKSFYTGIPNDQGLLAL